MLVHHRQDEDEISILGGIDYAIWKTADLTPTYVFFENSPGVWKAQETFYRGVNLYGKILTKAGVAAFIIIYGMNKFGFSFRMKTIPHLLNRLRALSNTMSPGTAFTFPERSS